MKENNKPLSFKKQKSCVEILTIKHHMLIIQEFFTTENSFP